MKKIIFALVSLCFLTGCGGSTDYIYRSHFKYNNQTSKDITIIYYSNKSIDGTQEPLGIFFIPKQDFRWLGVVVTETHFSGPFTSDRNWISGMSLTVSNGEKQFEQVVRDYNDADPLYMIETYTVIQKDAHYMTAEYTFTDQDFDEALPIEP